MENHYKFYTINKKVATEPFVTNQIKSTTNRGVAVIDQTQRLTPLKVVFAAGGEGFLPDDIVYVRGECMKHAWAGEVLTHTDGTKFILVPVDLIMAVTKDPKNLPSY